MRYPMTILAVTLLALPAAADDPPKKELTKAEKIYKALGERKDLDVKAQALSKALDAVTSLTDVSFERDPVLFPPVAGGPAGIPEIEIALKGSKEPVGETLNRALAPHGYTWVVLADRVVVTSFERSVSLQMHQRITVQAAGEPLSRTLSEVARQYGVNIVLDPEAAKAAEAKIDLRVQSAGLEGAVQMLATSAGLQSVRLTNSLFVTTPKKAENLARFLLVAPPAPTGQFGLCGAIGNFIGIGGALGALGVGGAVPGFGGALGAIGVMGGGPGQKKGPSTPMSSSGFPGHYGIARLAMAAPVPEKKGTDEPAAQRVRKELNTLVTIDIVNQSLPQAIGQLKDKTGIDFILDRTTLEAHFNERTGNGMDGVAVNLKLTRVPARRGLRQLLVEHDLGYVILGEQVLITTQAMTSPRTLRQPVSVDADKVTVADALRKLARDTATNLVLDARAAKEGQEKVSLQLDDVSLETAVKLLAEQAGLKAVVLDNVFFVTTKARATELREDPDFKRKPDPEAGTDETVPGPRRGGGGPAPVPAPIPPGVAPPKN